MTLRDIENDALDALGYDSTSAASAVVRVRVRRQINWAHRQLLATPGLLRLLRDSVKAFTFTTVAGVARYGLPSSLGRINSIVDPSNRERLGQITLEYIRDVDPDLTEVGPPSAYAPLGIFPVRTQPVATTPKLTVASTSAADTSQIVTLEYINANGDRVVVTGTLAGVAGVELGANVATNEITRAYLSAPAAGTVTLYNGTTAGTVLAVVPPGRTGVLYVHIQLWPTPAGPVTYPVDHTREIPDLLDPTDVPLVPPDFHELLSVGAQLREWRKADDARMGELKQEWETGTNRLKWWVMNPSQHGLFLGARSQLGPWFAAGT